MNLNHMAQSSIGHTMCAVYAMCGSAARCVERCSMRSVPGPSLRSPQAPGTDADTRHERDLFTSRRQDSRCQLQPLTGNKFPTPAAPMNASNVKSRRRCDQLFANQTHTRHLRTATFLGSALQRSVLCCERTNCQSESDTVTEWGRLVLATGHTQSIEARYGRVLPVNDPALSRQVP